MNEQPPRETWVATDYHPEALQHDRYTRWVGQGPMKDKQIVTGRSQETFTLIEYKGKEVFQRRIFNSLQEAKEAARECKNGRLGVPGECPPDCQGEVHVFNLEDFIAGAAERGIIISQ